MLTDLLPAGVHMPLEPFRQPHEDARIGTLVYGMHKKTGKEALGLGYGGFRPGPSRQMKRGMFTARATRHWEEHVHVRA
jgi:DNA polymerase V